MLIAIATWQSVLNHGAVLQANAMKLVLEELGHVVEFVDFSPERNGYQKIRRNWRDMLPDRILNRRKFTIEKRRLFNNFRNKHFLVCSQENAKWDRVIIGSDEVFSVEGGFNSVLFGLGYKCPVISYAASCGPTTIDDMKHEQNLEQIRRGIQQMKRVGVRDQNTFDIMQEISAVMPVLNIDPVLLYGYEKELRLKDNEQRKNVCIYSYTFNMNTREEIAAISALALRLGENVHSLGFYHPWCKKSRNISPTEIISNVSEYRFIVTDTFHGTILAIITHTPFCVILRNNSLKILDLLSTLRLLDRIVTDRNTIDILFNIEIDFEMTDMIIKRERTRSMMFLQEALGNKSIHVNESEWI